MRVWDGKGSGFTVERNRALDHGQTQARRLVGPLDRRAAELSGTDLDGVVINRATYRTLDGKVAVDVTPS